MGNRRFDLRKEFSAINGYFDILDDDMQEVIIERVLEDNLDERQQKVLYDLDLGKTQTQVAEELEISVSRVGMIRTHALRKLFGPVRSKVEQYIVDAVGNEIEDGQYGEAVRFIYESMQIKYTQLQEEVGSLRESVSQLSKKLDSVPVKSVDEFRTSSLPIEELGLSNRAYNAARHYQGFKTVGGLTDTSRSELLRCRHFGVKTVAEIEDKLSKLGLSLKE